MLTLTRLKQLWVCLLLRQDADAAQASSQAAPTLHWGPVSELASAAVAAASAASAAVSIPVAWLSFRPPLHHAVAACLEQLDQPEPVSGSRSSA